MSGRSHRFVHLATHGVLNNYHPELSGLLVAADHTPGVRAHDRDAELFEAYEVMRTSLECELATLSCCETALGRNLAGEGIVGLTRAFQHAGALNVCASLWAIPDDATPKLMTALYRRLIAGETPAQALSNAQTEISNTGAHPWGWAAFAIWG